MQCHVSSSRKKGIATILRTLSSFHKQMPKHRCANKSLRLITIVLCLAANAIVVPLLLAPLFFGMGAGRRHLEQSPPELDHSHQLMHSVTYTNMPNLKDHMNVAKLFPFSFSPFTPAHSGSLFWLRSFSSCVLRPINNVIVSNAMALPRHRIRMPFQRKKMELKIG